MFSSYSNACPDNLSLPGAIYLRLSKDDDGSGESLSIANQRKLLLRYASEHRFNIIREFVDDGYSGTTFDRPGFNDMIRAIEGKEIRLVLTKDLSRLGRDYIKTGQYTELFFPSRGIRFIAVGDGYDSAFSSTDLIPFRNIVNEMYARDISRKIRSSLLVRMEEGSYIGNFAPYGYMKYGKERHQLAPDPETAPIVLRIFRQTASGILPSRLAAELNSEQIPCPSLYRYMKNPERNTAGQGYSGRWSANTIIKILHNPVYLGHMIQGKTKKLSFKSKSTLRVPFNDQIKVLDTHPPIVCVQLFEQCEEQLKSRATRKKTPVTEG